MTRNVKIGIGIAVGLLVTFVVIRLITKKNRKLKKACEDRNGTWNKDTKKCNFSGQTGTQTGTQTGGSGNNEFFNDVPAWSPHTLAVEISKNIEGWNLLYVYPETAEKILELSDDRLKILYDYYNKNYAKDYPTLTQLFENESDDWAGKYDLVVARLKGLNLN